MSALENAKNMSVEDILAKTAASGLMEFGVERRTRISDESDPCGCRFK